jgi:uncharacterized membrane protein
MALSAYTIFYLVIGCFNVAAIIVLEGVLFTNYFRKRTVGSSLLISTFFALLLNEITYTISFFFQAFSTDPTILKYANALQYSGIIGLGLSVHWVYYFSNRHLLRDSDITKSYFTASLNIVIGLVVGIGIYNIINGGNPIWYQQIELTGSALDLILPTIFPPYGVLTYLIVVLAFGTYGRVIIRTLQLRRKAKDVVQKRGLGFVTASLILLVSIGFRYLTFYAGIGNTAIGGVIGYILHSIVVVLAVFTGYLGWIMPNWLRRRLREKTWISKLYTGKIPEPEEQSTKIDLNSIKAIEFTEQ